MSDDELDGKFLDGRLELIFGNVYAGPGYAVDVRSGEVYRNGELVGWAQRLRLDREALGWWVEYRARPFGPLDPRWNQIPADEAFLAEARRRGEPIDVRLAVSRDSGGEPSLLVVLETGVEWLIEFDPAAAAYLAGSLAMEAGVSFG